MFANPAIRSLLVLAVLLFPPAPTRAAVPDLKVDGAAANGELSVVYVTGRFGAGMPRVTLGGHALQPLTNDGTLLAAKLPVGLQPGTYQLAVMAGDGRSASLAVTLDRRDSRPEKPVPAKGLRGPGAVLDRVELGEDRTVLELYGQFGAGMPKVSLEGKTLQPLTNDGTFMAVRLPAAVRAGTYLLFVRTDEGRAGVLQVTLP